MINIRYHIVSIVAIFLALALGIIGGTTVINQGIVSSLKNQRKAYKTTNDSLEAEVSAKDDELTMWAAFGKATFPTLEAGLLRGVPVVELVEKDVATTAGIEDAIGNAGGTVAGKITFSDRWGLPDSQTAQELALALGETTTTATTATLVSDAATKLAGRLRIPADPTGHDDLLASLQRYGFISLTGAQAGAFPEPHAAFVYVSAGTRPAFPDHGNFAMTFLEGIMQSPTAVAEPMGSSDHLVDKVRGEASLAKNVATVDHSDTLVGQYSLVAALHDVIAGDPAPAYGTRHGASGVAPAPAPSKSATPTAKATPTPRATHT